MKYLTFKCLQHSQLQSTGGLGASKPVDDDVNELITRLKPEIIKKICEIGGDKCPSPDASIVVHSYKTQVVAGTNYFVGLVESSNLLEISVITQYFQCFYSATVDDVVYHFRIFSQPWTQTEQVTGVLGPKLISDEITHF